SGPLGASARRRPKLAGGRGRARAAPGHRFWGRFRSGPSRPLPKERHGRAHRDDLRERADMTRQAATPEVGPRARSSAGFARASILGEVSEGAVEAPADGAAWVSTS